MLFIWRECSKKQHVKTLKPEKMNTENNKIIAEFMGLKKFQSQLDYTIYDIPQHKIDVVTEQNGGTLFAEMDLKYHSDWNWLMEVVEKIEIVDFEVSIRGCIVTVVNKSGKSPYFQPHSVRETKILSVYEAVVKFINWHNQQKS